jgi:hypothetical protein
MLILWNVDRLLPYYTASHSRREKYLCSKQLALLMKELGLISHVWRKLAQLKKSKRIPFIFNDKSTGSCVCLRLDLYLSHVKITCATADWYCLYLCFPTPSTIRSQTCAYVTRMKDNVSRSFKPRHVIPDTRISSGQCTRCDVNVTWGARDFQGHTKKRALKHIHIKITETNHFCLGPF